MQSHELKKEEKQILNACHFGKKKTEVENYICFEVITIINKKDK